MQMLVSLTETSSPAKWSMLRFAGRIAARPTVAGNETIRHRVFGNAEDNGDCHGCRLRRQRDLWASSRGDHVDPLANQLGRQLRQSINLIFGPAVFDPRIL